jgi:hypothetical protein
MQSERVSPEGFIAERVEPKGMSAFVQHALIGALLLMVRLQRCGVPVIG